MPRPNATDRYIIQFQDWGIDQPWRPDCAFRDGQLERAKAYIEGILAAPQPRVKAGRVWDCDADQHAGEDPIVHEASVNELPLGDELSRNNVTCQPSLFDDDEANLFTFASDPDW